MLVTLFHEKVINWTLNFNELFIIIEIKGMTMRVVRLLGIVKHGLETKINLYYK